MGGIVIVMCWGARVRRGIEEDVENVCDETSKQHSSTGVYMHVMKERYAAGQLGGNFRSDSSIYIEGMMDAVMFHIQYLWQDLIQFLFTPAVRVGYEAPTPPAESSNVKDGEQTPTERIVDETEETKGLLATEDGEGGQQTAEGSSEV